MSFSIDARIRPRLEQVAFDENRSISSIVEILLMEHFSIPRQRKVGWAKRDATAAEMEFPEETNV